MTRLSHAQMVNLLTLMIHEKEQWLSKFASGKDQRPEWNVNQQRERLQVLKQACHDYTVERDRRAA